MRPTISTAALLMLVLGCGGRTLLDDPDDEILFVDGGRHIGTSSGGEGGDGSVKESDGGSSGSSSGASSGSSSGSSSGTISCGTQKCDSESEDCCASLTGMATAASCVAKGKCTGVVTECMGSSDCSEGDVCCASFGGAGGTLAGAGGALGGAAGGLGGLGGAGGLGGLGGTAGTGGAGGFNLSIACAKSCTTGGFQLCTSNSDCSKGVTCQATMFGAKLVEASVGSAVRPADSEASAARRALAERWPVPAGPWARPAASVISAVSPTAASAAWEASAGSAGSAVGECPRTSTARARLARRPRHPPWIVSKLTIWVADRPTTLDLGEGPDIHPGS